MGNLVGRDPDDKKKSQSPSPSQRPGYLDSDRRKKPDDERNHTVNHKNEVGSSGRAGEEDVYLQMAASGMNVGGKEETEDVNEKEVDSDVLLEQLCDDNAVPMVFRWEGGGKKVYITGTFNQWKEKIPMHRSGNDFTYIHDLKKEKHAFKFVVDNELRFAPEQPTVANAQGLINNYVDLTGFEKTFGNEPSALSQMKNIVQDSLYEDDYAPDPDDPQWYTKEPPQLPPHLRHIILNAKTPRLSEAGNCMQVPQHVTLNHLYCSAIKNNLMVLGVTQRFREKFVTTVFYSPIADTT